MGSDVSITRRPLPKFGWLNKRVGRLVGGGIGFDLGINPDSTKPNMNFLKLLIGECPLPEMDLESLFQEATSKYYNLSSKDLKCTVNTTALSIFLDQ